MNKKLFVSLLTAGAMSAMAMTSFAGELTAEEVLANYAAASATLTEATCKADVKADVTLNIPDLGMDLGVNAGMNLDMAMDMDPLAVSATGAANVSLMGEEIGVDMSMYLVPEEDGMAAYVDATLKEGEDAERECQKIAISAEDTAQIMELIASSSEMQFDLSTLPVAFTLADGTVDVEGTECYEVTTTITAEDAPALLGFVMETATTMVPEAAEELPELPSEEELSMVASMLTGLQVNITLDVAADTFQPVRAHIDMDGSDWGIVATLAASYLELTNEDGSLMEVNVSADNLYLDYIYNYDEVGEITVPQDVIDNAVETSAEEVEAMAMDMVEEVESEN